jgi:hypothetical protein
MSDIDTMGPIDEPGARVARRPSTGRLAFADIAGTATAVSNNVSRRQHERWAAKAQAAPQQQYAAPPPPAPVAAPPSGGLTQETIDALKQLADLKEQGILSEAEFEVEKAKLLSY